MKILSQLTPAETLLIINSEHSSLKDLMKKTFMDLLLKKVIAIKEVHKKAHSRDRIERKYTYVVAGVNLKKYTAKSHELIFLSAFLKNNSIRILFPSYIKMVYENSKSSYRFKTKVIENKAVVSNFKSNLFLTLFQAIKINSEGIKLKAEISEFLNPIDENIDFLLNNDKKKALELLLTIGGNIFLLENLDFKLLQKIDKALLQQFKNKGSELFDTGSDSWLYLEFFDGDSTYDSYFNTFENVMDSFDSESDSVGCSSCDSGCSSCGGCGGCD